MPPKLSAAQIDEKLEELHTFVREHAALLASRNGSSLCESLRQTASTEERKWYFFLHKSARALSESQKNRVLQTYALLAAHTRTATQRSESTLPSSSAKVASAASTSMAAPAAEQRRTQSRVSTSAPAAEQRQLSLESCAAASTAASAAEQRRQQTTTATSAAKPAAEQLRAALSDDVDLLQLWPPAYFHMQRLR